MRLDRLKAFALSLPHATFVKQWGETLVFKIDGKKMFLIVGLDGDTPEHLSFKCSPANYERLVDQDGIKPCPHNLYKSHWITLEDPDVMGETELTSLLCQAYALVFAQLPKKTQAALSAAS
jgi:predicted DNA-binding protein (MmcQ/YjbR family)